MGRKHTKLPSADTHPASNGTDPATGDSAIDIEALLKRTALHLERLLHLVEVAVSEGQADPAIVRESAGIARAQISMAAELRARTKQAMHDVKRIPMPMVMAKLRSLDAEERRHVARELLAMDEDGSVLS